MQCVILAAGRGVRMRPLTDTTPKPLLCVAGRPLLEYTFDALPDEVDEVIVVIGYLGEQIRAYLGESFRGRRIKYVVQDKLEGTAKALWEAKPLITGRFLVLMADDIYVKEDIEKCLEHEQAMLVYKQTQPSSGGEVVLDANGNLVDVVERDSIPAGKLVGTNVFILTPEFFTIPPLKKSADSPEYGLPQTVVEMSKRYPVTIVEATRWIKITTPEDLQAAETLLKS
jgi:NDP-sugar pyrophosphorylase family protein